MYSFHLAHWCPQQEPSVLRSVQLKHSARFDQIHFRSQFDWCMLRIAPSCLSRGMCIGTSYKALCFWPRVQNSDQWSTSYLHFLFHHDKIMIRFFLQKKGPRSSPAQNSRFLPHKSLRFSLRGWTDLRWLIKEHVAFSLWAYVCVCVLPLQSAPNCEDGPSRKHRPSSPNSKDELHSPPGNSAEKWRRDGQNGMGWQ